MDKHNPLSNLAYTLARHIPLAGAVTAGLTLSVALGASQFAAWAADGLLHNIRFDQGSRHFVIDTTGPVKAVVNTLTIAGRKRVIIDLDNADIGGDLPRDAQLLQDLTAQMPTLKNVTVNQYGGNGRPIVRVLLDLQGDPGAVRLLRNQGPHIELEISDYAASSPTGPSDSTGGYGGAPIYQGNNSGSNSGYGGGDYSSRPSTGNRYGNSTPTIDQSGYPSSERSISSRISTGQPGNQSSNQSSNQASGPQLDEMKRTLVVMNQRYDQLAQENRSLKNKLAVSQNQNTQNSTSNSGELSRLQGQITQLNTQNNDLSTQIQNLTSRNSEIQTRLTQALASATAARNSVASSTAQQSQLDESRKKVADLSNQLDLLRQDHRLQSQQVEQLILDKATLNNQISQLKTQLASKAATPSQPNISDSELQELRRQLGSAQQAMSDSLKTIKEQNQEMAYLRNQINTVKSGMDAAAKEQIGSLQSANETKDKTIAAKDTTIADLRQQLEREKTNNSAAQIAGIKTQMTNLQTQNDSNNRTHQLELQDLNKQLLDKNSQIAALHQQLDDVVDRQNNHPTTAALRQKDARISELEKAVFTANQQVLASQTTQRQLDEAKAQIAQLKANEEQRQAAERELGTTKAQLARYETAQKQLEAAQVDLRITKSQLAQMQADESQLKAARQDLIALKAELEKVKAQGASSGKSSASQQTALASLTQNNQKLSQQLESVNAQLKIAQQQLASRPTTDNSAQMNQLQKQVSDLNQQLQQANAQLKAAQSKTPVASTGKATPANNLQLMQLQKQIGDLNQQLSSLRSENVDLRNSASKPSGPGGTNPDAETAYQEAKTAQKAKRIPDSLDKFKAALLLDPDNSRYAIDYSIALSEDQQYAEAIDMLRRYLQHNPTDREAYNQLGKIYLLNDQPDAANQSFVRAIPVSTINNYATSLKKLGKLDDAEKMFKLALSLNPKDSEVLFNLGNLYNNQNKLDLARNRYLEAIQIRPDFAEAHYNLGLIFSKLGDNPKAIEHLEMFLRLSPNARNAETIRAYVQKLKA